MKTRLFLGCLAVGCVALGLWLLLRPSAPPASVENLAQPIRTPPTVPATVALPPDSVPRLATSGSGDDATFEGIEKLNARELTIHDDLRLLNDLFFSWQVTYPKEGNPVGSNQEITAAFTGTNLHGLALIPRSHPALSRNGELLDRWGTPFFFHQLSRSRMEIRSAGPDRKLYTEDDALYTP